MRSLILLVLAAAPGFAAHGEGSLPVFFFPNAGVTDPSIRFIAETPELRAGFRADSVVFQIGSGQNGFHTQVVRFAGANPYARIEGADATTGKVNFLLGQDAAQWTTGLSMYRKIVYRNLYPGVDASYGGDGRGIKVEFMVSPGASPDQVRLEYKGAKGISISASGDLVVRGAGAEFREQAPVVYQYSGKNQVRVGARYCVLHADTIGFELGPYDTSRTLIIDPVVSFSTYLGGTSSSAVTGLAVDSSGNVYATGWTAALNFPIVGAVQAANQGGVDAFVVKLNAAGTALIYATYIGGRGADQGAGIAVDSSGEAYVTGFTESTNFPLVSAVRTTLGGSRNAFALKLNAAGNLPLYSTYLGGTNYDMGNAIAVDGSGDAYIAGDAQSANFPVTSGAFQTSLGGQTDAFVTKLKPSGAISYSTFLGGAKVEHAGAVAVDASGNAYVAGGTFSSNFPLASPIQSVNGGGEDAFVTKLNPTGAAILYSTYLGGNGGTMANPEQANAIAVDASGNAYVAGVTNSSNFPVSSGAFQTTFDGFQNAFVSKINAAGNTLIYGTYLGGSGFDWASGISLGPGGIAYIAGATSSADFPTVYPLQSLNGLYNSFIAEFSASGNTLIFSTYFGGTNIDFANAIALDASGNIVTGGQTNSTDFPLQSPLQSTNLGGSTGWLLRLAPASGVCSFSLNPASFSSNARGGNSSIGLIASGGACSWTAASNATWLTITAGASGTGNGTTSYSIASNTASARSGTLILGAQTFTVYQAAAVLSPAGVSPGAGSGLVQTFTFTFDDPDGYADINLVDILINNVLDGIGACYVAFVPSGPSAGSVYLVDDGGDAGGPYSSMALPGTGTARNSQCTINGTGSSTSASGNTLTVNLEVTFAPSFAGNKVFYLAAGSKTQPNSGWWPLGTWDAPGTAPVGPAVGGVVPAQSATTGQTYTFTFTDTNGFSDLAVLDILINGSLDGISACYIAFAPTSASSGQLYLVDDASDGGYASGSPAPLPSSVTLQNSQCTIAGAGSSVSASGNTLTLRLAITFSPSFAGDQVFYLGARNNGTGNSGWQAVGSVSVP